jgi:hypothetical protein
MSRGSPVKCTCHVFLYKSLCKKKSTYQDSELGDEQHNIDLELTEDARKTADPG